MLLNLNDYDLDFREDGSVSLKIEYMGGMEGVMYDDRSDVLFLSVDGKKAKELREQRSEEEQKKIQEMLDANKDVSGRVRENLQANIDKIKGKYRVHVLHQRGMQMETYDNNLYEAHLKLNRDNLPINASLIRKDDESTFIAFEQNLLDIKTSITKQAAKKGLATTDKDGNTTLSEISKVRLAQETSKGITNSIEALIDGGKKEEAKILLNRYGDRLKSDAKNALLKKLDKTQKTDDANVKMREIQNLPLEKQIEAIDKIEDPELRSKVLDMKSSMENKMSSLRKQSEDQSYEMLSTKVNDMMAKGQLHGLSDLESNPEVKLLYGKTWDRMSEKQRQTIREQFEDPKSSDPKVYGKVLDILNGKDNVNKLEEMSYVQFQEHLAGLTKADKTIMNAQFRSLTSNADNLSKVLKISKDAAEIGENELYSQELLQKKDGKLSDDDLAKLNKFKADLRSHIDELGPNPSAEKTKEYVKHYISQAVAAKTFKKPGSWLSVFGGSSEPAKKIAFRTPKVVTAKEDPTIGMDNLSKNKLKFKYVKKYGLNAYDVKLNDPAFLDFVRENK
jgi:hypothetical protein